MTLAALVAAALMALASVAGCGAGGSTAGEAIDFEQLSQAAATSADAKTGRFTFALEMALPGAAKPFGFSGEGAFDATADRASLSFDLSSFAELLGGMFAGLAGPGSTGPDFGDPAAWQIDAVQDGEVMYMRFPAMASELPAGKSWVRMDLDEQVKTPGIDFNGLQDLASNDPRKMLDFLRATSDEVETVGTEELRGVSTTHYRAKLSLADYENLVPAPKRAEARTMLGELVEQTGLAELPVDVWLDESGLVRRFEMTFSATQPGTAESLDGSMTFELFDYGKAVDVALPPADDVVDAASLD